MRLHFRIRAVGWNGEIQRQVERSIQFAVDRYSDRIERISVYVTDLNGSRGVAAVLCQITAIVKGANPTLILQRGDDLVWILNRAIRRLSYHISRNIKRARMPAGNEYRATIRAA